MPNIITKPGVWELWLTGQQLDFELRRAADAAVAAGTLAPAIDVGRLKMSIRNGVRYFMLTVADAAKLGIEPPERE